MKNWQRKVIQVMAGRYGYDELGYFLLYTTTGLLILNIFIVKNSIFGFLIWALFITQVFRVYSKNIIQRRNENNRYKQFIRPITKRITVFKKQKNDKDHKYFLCPSCKQITRVPRNRGKITITCPKCGVKFSRKS